MKSDDQPICRLAEHSDVPALSVLFDAYRQFYGQQSDVAGAEAFLRKNMEERRSVIYLVPQAAHEGADLLGFAQLYPTLSSISMQRVWTLNDLYVLPVSRGHGVGSSLLDAVAAHARESGAKGVELSTAADNLTARRLYEKAGYVRDLTFVHYFLSLEG
ncbi:GNAT family N-acetyltransferase [Paenibacillus puerhi]|uniref:GNAT family N-acetyltransferase n=1 Tax=Paenibacillus puerhi TaxID=2692622 RepID=UPI0013570B90|nr:GNAT family N-acetyltransferase [Paenibacillus puerhi]